MNIKGNFRNLTDLSYKIYSDASFSKSRLIHINVYKQDDEEMLFVGIERIVDISPKQWIDEEVTKKMTEKGKFKIVVSSNIEIENPVNSDIMKHNLMAKKIYIK